MSDELIARLEAAAEGSNELSREVSQCVGTHLPGIPPVRPNAQDYAPESFPSYTTSIDAALQLVDGRLDFLGQQRSPDMGGKMWHATVSTFHPFRAHAFTPALALCVASLKARQS